MIPSRGLRWSSQTVGVCRRNLKPTVFRNFCSITVQQKPLQSNPLLSVPGALFRELSARAHITRTNNVIGNGKGIRFASTTPAPIVAASSPITNASSTAPDVASSSVIASPEFAKEYDSVLELLPDTISNIPESIGYLKALGLDYGWGPTALMEWTLEHIHIYAGTPWWISIGLTAIFVRVVLLQPYLGAADNAARLATIKPVTEPITARMKQAQRAGDVDAVLKTRQELSLVHKRAGIKIWKSFIPAVQIFTGYGTFVLLRAMARLPVPGLETGGALWFYNLTIPDPYFLLPAMTAGVLHWVLRQGGETGQNNLSPEMAKAFMYGLPALTLVFTSWLPAGVQLSFFVSGVLSCIQAFTFRNAKFRRYFNMTPLPTATPNPSSGPPSPYKGTLRLASNANTPSSPTYSAPSRRVNPALSTTELNSRFQASSSSNSSTASSSPTEQQAPTSRTQALLKKLRQPITEVADSGRAIMAKGNKSMDERRTKSDMEEKKRYEAKRQQELKRERWEKENERRAERAARQAARKGDL